MIRIGLFSEDATLQSLLATALGKEFSVLLEPGEDGIKGLLAAGECDVVVVDLKTKDPLLQDRIDGCRRLIGELVSTVVLADDGLRSAIATTLNFTGGCAASVTCDFAGNAPATTISNVQAIICTRLTFF